MQIKYGLAFLSCLLFTTLHSQTCISEKNGVGYFPIVSATSHAVIYVDSSDHILVQKAAAFFQKDIERVTGKTLPIVYQLKGNAFAIIIGSYDGSVVIRQLAVKPELHDTTFTPEKEQAQIEMYKRCFEIFRKYRKSISGVTFWNISDKRSWLDNFRCG